MFLIDSDLSVIPFSEHSLAMVFWFQTSSTSDMAFVDFSNGKHI